MGVVATKAHAFQRLNVCVEGMGVGSDTERRTAKNQVLRAYMLGRVTGSINISSRYSTPMNFVRYCLLL